MNRHRSSFGLVLVTSLLLATVPHAYAADCPGWAVDRNRLGSPERDHGSLRIETTEGVWKWEYGADDLLDSYAVAFKTPDEAAREKKLEKLRKRLTSKHGPPSEEDPFAEATEEHLHRFLVVDPRGNESDRWLADVTPDGVWYSEDCDAHISLFHGSAAGQHYVLILLRTLSEPSGK